MKKMVIRVLCCGMIAVGCWMGSVIMDREALGRDLVRLHVVANSDGEEDQRIKLQVRDAVIGSIREGMEQAGDPEAARAYLREKLPGIERAANETLKALGCEDRAVVTLCKEAFDRRIYDTFSLPGGLYDALRITIGEGQGHNWWCVAYPSLCIPAASSQVEAVAADAGLSEGLQGAMTGRYQLRFLLLDLLGKLEVRLKNR